MLGCREGSAGTVRPRQCLGSCCIIDQTAGCEWPLPRSQWLSTGCEISATTTSALFPLQLDAIYSPNPDLPSGKSKKKKHSHTREKSTCKPLRALRIKHTDLKLLLSRTFSPSFPLLAAAPEEVLRSAGHRLNFSPGLTPRALAQKNTGFTS